MEGFRAQEPRVPSLDEISTMYRRAVDSQNPQLQAAAERAVHRLAAAEAAVVEAATLVDFGERVKG
jgi:hypothetical protein